jgi:hypothetical protein
VDNVGCLLPSSLLLCNFDFHFGTVGVLGQPVPWSYAVRVETLHCDLHDWRGVVSFSILILWVVAVVPVVDLGVVFYCLGGYALFILAVP